MEQIDTIKHICRKFNIDLKENSPFTINCGKWYGFPALFKELGFKSGAEIGVLRGLWSEKMCKSIPNLKMYCIDKWIRYLDYTDYEDKKLKEYGKIAKGRLKKYNCNIIEKWSMDAVKDFKDESLDFVFIDGNHSFQYVVNDIAEWSKKVRKGGIVSGHDMLMAKRTDVSIHVGAVVKAWTLSYEIHPWFICKDIDPYVRGISWMWVKE